MTSPKYRIDFLLDIDLEATISDPRFCYLGVVRLVMNGRPSLGFPLVEMRKGQKGNIFRGIERWLIDRRPRGDDEGWCYSTNIFPYFTVSWVMPDCSIIIEYHNGSAIEHFECMVQGQHPILDNSRFSIYD